MSHIVEAIEILRATNDGNKLAPRDLYLVQLAVNNDLSEAGEIAFTELVAHVKRGYVKPWHFDVEHITKDHQGFMYWRGVKVEHYSFSNANEERAATIELAKACRYVEERGGKVTGFASISDALDQVRQAQ